MKKDPTPAVGDIWIKHTYKSVGYPTGRVTVTDVVHVKGKVPIVHYHYIAGTQAGKALERDATSFVRIYVHGSSPLPQAPLPLPEHTEAYRGDEEL